ncbi:MAG: outer membrane lipid asymmetry maintenance protein MlaD [Pseudomonadota bacterium]
MVKSGVVETLVGIVVVVVAAAFLVYAYGVSGRDATRGAYELSAVFGRVDGIASGSDVRVSGVKVGVVTGAALDPATYEARVTMAISPSVAVPEDSSAKIVMDGLLGGAHVAIEPGAAEDMLASGETITVTQGSVDLLGLAVRAFTNNAASEGGAGAGEDGASE